MQACTSIRRLRYAITVGMIVTCISACSTAVNMRPDQLASIGVTEGASYWQAVQKLTGEGYQCFVSGAKRENFDCTKTQGFFPTCLLRIEFTVDDNNLISHVRAANPACLGTP